MKTILENHYNTFRIVLEPVQAGLVSMTELKRMGAEWMPMEVITVSPERAKNLKEFALQNDYFQLAA